MLWIEEVQGGIAIASCPSHGGVIDKLRRGIFASLNWSLSLRVGDNSPARCSSPLLKASLAIRLYCY